MLEFKEIRSQISKNKPELHRRWLCLGISVAIHVVFLVSIFFLISPGKVYFSSQNVRRVFIAPMEKLFFPEGGIESVYSQPSPGEVSVSGNQPSDLEGFTPAGRISSEQEAVRGAEAAVLDPGWSSQFRLSLPALREKNLPIDQELDLVPRDTHMDRFFQRIDRYREREGVDFSKYRPTNYLSSITGRGSRNRAGSRVRANSGPGISLKEVNYDLSPWAEKVVAKIQKTWLVSSEQMSRAVGQVEIAVIVNKNGEVESVKIVQASQASLLDETALKALELSSPFPNLPYTFPEEQLEIRLVFLIQ